MNGDKLISSCCPEGYYGHYTVLDEDSPAFLASLFSISEADLLKANPHLNPDETLPAGTKIHIPGLILFPAGINFTQTGKDLPFAHGGGAFIHLSPEGGQSVSVIATLPASSYFGAYDLYVLEVMVTSNNIFEGQLFATPDDPPSWAARIDLPFLTSLSPESRIVIRPFNSESGIAGDMILEIDFSSSVPCCEADHKDTLSITSEDLPDNHSPEENDPALPDSILDDETSIRDDEAEVFDEIETLSGEQSYETSSQDEITGEEIATDIENLPSSAEDNPVDTIAAAGEKRTTEEEEIPDSETEISMVEALESPYPEAMSTEKDAFATVGEEEGPVAGSSTASRWAETGLLPAENERLVAEEADHDNLPAEKVLPPFSGPQIRPFRFNSYPAAQKARTPVNLVLNAAGDAQHAIGIASIQLSPSQIMVVALKLPEPYSLGPQYKYYMAWLIDAGNNKTASIPMKKILNGVWTAQSSNSNLKSFDIVLVTAEVSQNISKPSGPELLLGLLSSAI